MQLNSSNQGGWRKKNMVVVVGGEYKLLQDTELGAFHIVRKQTGD